MKMIKDIMWLWLYQVS